MFWKFVKIKQANATRCKVTLSCLNRSDFKKASVLYQSFNEFDEEIIIINKPELITLLYKKTVCIEQKKGAYIYQVVTRKYSPRNFNELVGQNHVSRALTSTHERGR